MTIHPFYDMLSHMFCNESRVSNQIVVSLIVLLLKLSNLIPENSPVAKRTQSMSVEKVSESILKNPPNFKCSMLTKRYS